MIKKAQNVFNEGVKIISGVFWTAPREPLHEITRVLPTHFYIDILTHTSALRLYRVPPTSQLLTHLGPEWRGGDPGGLHSSNGGAEDDPYRQVRLGRPAQYPTGTALEALGARIPSDGRRSDAVAMSS